MSEHDDVLDGTLRELLGHGTVWDDGPLDGADALVATIAAERAAAVAARPTTRRAARWLAPIAAAIVAVAVTIAAYGVLTGRDTTSTSEPPADVTVTMRATELAPDATATAAVTARPLGTVIRLDARGLPPAAPGTYYEAWMHAGDTAVSAGTFHMRGGDGAVYLWSGVVATEYPELTVTVQTAGDVTPSGQVVLQARLD